jgi:hypothetical protein
MSELPQDPAVRTPASVAAAAALAESFYTKETAAEPPKPAPGEVVQPLGDQPAPVTLQVTQQPPAPPAEHVDEQSWEHRYKSMKGRYDQSQNQLREQGQRIADLEAYIQQQQRPAPAQHQPAHAQQRYITPQEEQEWGSEFVDVVGRRAKEIAAEETAQLRAEIDQLKGQVQNVGSHVVNTAKQQLKVALAEQVPNWEAINTSEQFLNWLALPDSYSGVIRQKLLRQAYERNDTPRVVAFFQGFLAEAAAVDPVQHGADIAKVPLESLAAPGRAQSAAGTQSTPEKPIITRAQIAAFYRDVAQGKYAGRDQEKDRLELLINSANREGRIRS